MHRHLAFVLMLLLWHYFHALAVDALAIAPQSSIITAINQTEMSRTVALTVPKAPLNGTLAPLHSAVTYHVENSPTTLLLHSFGSLIPANELLQAIATAVGIAFDYIGEGKGDKPIVTGLFSYSHEFLNQNVVNITVGDFREIGRPMNYNVLCDTLRGIGEFALLQERRPEEMSFEVDVKDKGYLGSGHVDYQPAAPPRPTSSVA